MSNSGTHASLLTSHLLWPVLVFCGGVLLLQAGTIDLMVADWIYHRWGDAWVWRDAWLTRQLIHEGGRALVSVMIVLLLGAFAATWFLPAWRVQRRGLSFLVVSTLLAGLFINLLKQVTHIDCPWDLLRYGGAYAYAGLFDGAAGQQAHGACFPAGHASAAYAWFGLYYLAREYRPRWRWPVFSGILLLGLVFGVGQQLRGAHFISHDWWTASLCWFVATACYLLFFPSAAFARSRPGTRLALDQTPGQLLQRQQ